SSLVFFVNDTATTEIYTLSLHDALPILFKYVLLTTTLQYLLMGGYMNIPHRSEEHTSELQSHSDLVCRLLLEKNCVCRTLLSARRPVGCSCPGRRPSSRPNGCALFFCTHRGTTCISTVPRRPPCRD